jgi:hypothetical protein
MSEVYDDQSVPKQHKPRPLRATLALIKTTISGAI